MTPTPAQRDALTRIADEFAGLAHQIRTLTQPETPAQDAHTPRTAPQTRPGGTESGEGGEGAREGVRWFVPTLVWRDGHPDHAYRIEVREHGVHVGDVIATPDELNTLPRGTVVIDNGADAWKSYSNGEAGHTPHEWGNTLGDAPGQTTPEEPDYPLTVVWVPGPRDAYGFPSIASPLPEVADVLRTENERLKAQVDAIRAAIEREAAHGDAVTRCNLVAERFRTVLDGASSEAGGNGEVGV